MPGQDDTIVARPLPRKPDTGLQAWLATIGYIASEYSPDATLLVRAAMIDGELRWQASAAWAQVTETGAWQPTLPVALKDLWKVVEAGHRIFKTLEAATKRPANYPEHRWVDDLTAETLARLTAISAWAFGTDWSLLLIYRPIDSADDRVTGRLSARGGTIQIGGRAASIPAACVAIYRHAAPGYFGQAGSQHTDFFTQF